MTGSLDSRLKRARALVASSVAWLVGNLRTRAFEVRYIYCWNVPWQVGQVFLRQPWSPHPLQYPLSLRMTIVNLICVNSVS